MELIMYKSYFGFSDSPFENNLDQRFLFFSANHKEVTAALLYFIKWKKSFAMVCGDVGTGKTMLINYLLNNLPGSVHPIMIANPDVGYMEILRYIAGILKIDTRGKRVLDLVDHVKAALVEASRKGNRFVLIIDEAHLLSDKSIEQIRLLSNIETQEHKLFQILLLGQYELSHKLNRPEMRQLRQRININRFLAPMDSTETIQYIDHRLQMAGSSFDDCFESNCKDSIFKKTNGVPRSINQLCDSALLVCKAEKQHKVNRKILKKAYLALRSDILFTPGSRAERTPSKWKMLKPLAAFGVFAIILTVFGISGYGGVIGEKAQYFLSRFYFGVLTPPAEKRHPVTDTPVHPEVSASTIKPDFRHSLKLSDSSIKDISEMDLPAPAPPKPVASSDKNNSSVFYQVHPESESISRFPETQMPLSARDTPQNIYQNSDSGADLPEINQTTQNHVYAAQVTQPSNIDRSQSMPGKNVQTEGHFSPINGPGRFVVQKGDTLSGIASRLYPMDSANGLKEIVAANPMIDDINLIITGQELIIPEPGH